MKYITILFCLLIPSCSLIPMYTIPDDDAKWINKTTGEDAPIEILSKCEKQASFSVIGRSSNPNIVDTEYMSNLEKIRNIKGKCLYEKGFIFKIKYFSAYCYHLEEVCKAYEKYRK